MRLIVGSVYQKNIFHSHLTLCESPAHCVQRTHAMEPTVRELLAAVQVRLGEVDAGRVDTYSRWVTSSQAGAERHGLLIIIISASGPGWPCL